MFKSLLPSAAAAFALLITPVAASAHTKLVSSTPAANSTVSKVTSVILQFNEKIVASTLKTELVMTGMPGMANHAPMKVPYRSEEHTSELQSLMRISYAVFCLKKKK